MLCSSMWEDEPFKSDRVPASMERSVLCCQCAHVDVLIHHSEPQGSNVISSNNRWIVKIDSNLCLNPFATITATDRRSCEYIPILQAPPPPLGNFSLSQLAPRIIGSQRQIGDLKNSHCSLNV